MLPNCEKCIAIAAEERSLDALAAALDRQIAKLLRPAHEENNRRWAAFAARCRWPLVGRLFLRIQKAPTLVPLPKYWDEPWYRDNGGTVQTRACALERLKLADLEHWGDEIVSPADSSDPAGYYTPDRATRRECYRLGLTPFLPNKYDYHSAAGCDKHEVDLLVMCSETLALMPVAQCTMTVGERTGWKPIYTRAAS